MSFKSNKKELLMSTEAKLANLLHEMNSDSREEDGRLVCETECTMARIRSYSDFLYALRVKPLQTVCYYGAAVFLLLALAALWCREWLLAAIFGVIFFVLATLPHNMRIQYFNKQADKMEQSYGKVINAEFAEDAIKLKITPAKPQKQNVDENGNATARRSVVEDSGGTEELDIPYDRVVQAFECAHSFYIFPVAENRSALETVICDKTQFLCGTPMQLRDMLARKCGKRLKLKMKIR